MTLLIKVKRLGISQRTSGSGDAPATVFIMEQEIPRIHMSKRSTPNERYHKEGRLVHLRKSSSSRKFRSLHLIVHFLTRTSSVDPVHLATVTALVILASLLLYSAILKTVVIKGGDSVPCEYSLR
jgi:hypothetical protein